MLNSMRCRTATPEARQARTAIIEIMSQTLNGMRFSRLAVCFSVTSIVSFRD
jgi:hypothetical protein